eukprot:403344914
MQANLAAETVHTLIGQEEEYMARLKVKKNLENNAIFTVHGKIVQYSKKSLFFFEQENTLRKALVWLTEWRYFDRFIMLIILVNSICLAMFDYSDRDITTYHNQVLYMIGNCITVIFAIEAAIKIVAQGFVFHKLSYMRDPWNLIDMTIVITGQILNQIHVLFIFRLADLVASSVNLKSLRILRVLRPLRSINAIPSMRRIVRTLLQSLPELGNATIFLSFMIVLFGILGLQQFNGILYNKCRLTEQPVNSTYWPKSKEFTRVCSQAGDGDFVCPNGLYCGNPIDYGISLDDDGVYFDERIQFGISSFSNFGQAILAVFQIITKDNWSQLMYNLSDGYTSAFGKIYCIFIIVIGSYFMLNLILAVIMSNFTKISQLEQKIYIKKMEKELSRQDRRGTAKSVQLEVLTNTNQRRKSQFQLKNKGSSKSININKRDQMGEFQPIKEEKEEELDQQQIFLDSPDRAKLSPFKQLMMIKKQKEAEKLQQAKAIQDLSEQSNTLHKQHSLNTGKNIATGFGLALMSKAFSINPQEDEQINNIKRQLTDAESNQDLMIRIKMQQKLYDEQKKTLQRMDLDIRKRYAMSKNNVYGIDNENQIIQQIQTRLQEVLIEREKIRQERMIEKGFDPSHLDEDIEDELEEKTLVSLKVAQNLKELTMKQHIKELMFNKFKSQLIKKNMIEKLFNKIDEQMISNLLLVRASKNRWYSFSLVIVKSYLFSFIIVLSIIGNAIVLAMDRYPIDRKQEDLLEVFNLTFFGLFLGELILKLSANGIKFYLRDKFNWFDGGVVVISSIDVITSYTVIDNSAGSGAISALRVFRLIRIFQLAKVWKDFQDLLTVITNTIKDISNISILMGLFILIYALLGMELFAYKAQFDKDNRPSNDGEYPQSTFNSFIQALVSVFIVLANDGWTKIFFNHYRVTDSVTASFYFLSLLIFGQFILLNLFIAILIENFEQVSLHQDTVNRHKNITWKVTLAKICQKIFYCCKKRRVRILSEIELEKQKKKQENSDLKEKGESSLYIFTPNNRFRKFLLEKVSSNKFEYLMIGFIVANSVLLALDNPLNDPNSQMSDVLFKIDGVLTAAFLLEAAIKIIAYGFAFCGSTSYIRNSWNIADLLIAILSLVSLIVSSQDLSVLKVLRLLKVLRPIRVISKNEGLKISIRSLGIALPGIFNVIIITLVFHLIFGVIGINYLKGRLFLCDTKHLPNFDHKSIQDKWECLVVGGEWNRFFLNFDNIGQAMSSLFQISTTINWVDLMYQSAATTDIDLAPQHFYNTGIPIFFIAFIVVGNFFLLNLFVGVVISTYNREKEVLGKNFLLTKKQRKWLNNKIMLIQSKPMIRMKKPNQDWRGPFFQLATNSHFDKFILICILINTVILAVKWYGQHQALDNVTETINYVFAFVFIAEVVIKIIAFGVRYFKDDWNNFDVLIAVITIISMILASKTSVQLGPNTTIVRSFRIGRVFKLFRRNKSLKIIFQTFMLALPALANIGSLLLLIIFIYSILGMYLFADVKLGGLINNDANFQNMGNSIQALFRISTGGDWPKLMNDYQQGIQNQFQCIKNPTYDDYVNNNYETIGCGDYYFSLIYFFSYVVLVDLLYLKLFIAIILQGFHDITEKDNKLLNSDHSDHFREIWSVFDPNATTFIRCTNYGKFLIYLGDPLGWDSSYEFNYLKQEEYLALVDLPKYNHHKDYQFMDVFENLALLMIVRKEVSDYLGRYNEKLNNLQQLKHLLSVRQGLGSIEEERSYSSVLFSSDKNVLSSDKTIKNSQRHQTNNQSNLGAESIKSKDQEKEREKRKSRKLDEGDLKINLEYTFQGRNGNDRRQRNSCYDSLGQNQGSKDTHYQTQEREVESYSYFNIPKNLQNYNFVEIKQHRENTGEVRKHRNKVIQTNYKDSYDIEAQLEEIGFDNGDIRGGVFAMVVHNPIAKGHVLVCPRNAIARYRDLDTKDLFEISLTVQLLTRFLQDYYQTDSSTVSIQEGQGAGQMINHLHVHIIPRFKGDFKNNDDIYPLIEKFDENFLKTLAEDNSTNAQLAEDAAFFKRKLNELVPEERFTDPSFNF